MININPYEFFETGHFKIDTLYWDIVYFLTLKSGRVMTPSLITKELSKRYDSLSHNTVKAYLKKIVDAGVFTCVDRVYVKGLPRSGDVKLAYNKTYYLSPEGEFEELISMALSSGFDDNRYIPLARAKTTLFNILKQKGYNITSGVVNIFGKEKNDIGEYESYKRTYSIDFVVEKPGFKAYITFPEENYQEKDIIKAYLIIHDNWGKYLAYENKPYTASDNGIITCDINELNKIL